MRAPSLPRLACLFALPLLVGAAHGADPFPGADVAAGQQLHARHCAACHAGKFGGVDGSGIYTRADRRVNTAAALTRQISFCTRQLGLQFFPEDELNLAGYLNQRYYRFQ